MARCMGRDADCFVYRLAGWGKLRPAQQEAQSSLTSALTLDGSPSWPSRRGHPSSRSSIALWPMEYNFELFRSSIFSNRGFRDRVFAFKTALGEAESAERLCMKPAYASAGGNKFNGQISNQGDNSGACLDMVSVTTLSKVLGQLDSSSGAFNIDVMKLDCEGYEVRVLQGAVEHFRTYPPCLIESIGM
jgi:FkbM family methyltransferase